MFLGRKFKKNKKREMKKDVERSFLIISLMRRSFYCREDCIECRSIFTIGFELYQLEVGLGGTYLLP
ncbi:unnamed protein product [Amoebophrya sp. A25]|nr:unnamed protein product [Amoebophrya sp. A25]|eukprot:GSA25T00019739001.1